MWGSIGVAVVVIGTMFTLFEWLKPFSGHKFNHERDQFIYGIDPVIDGALPVETDQYIAWKLRRKKLIVIGFIFIVIGSVFQILDGYIL